MEEELKKLIDERVTKKFKELIKKNKNLNLRDLLNLTFDNDFDSILNIFKDEDTTIKVISTLNNSDIEIRILAKMLLNK